MVVDMAGQNFSSWISRMREAVIPTSVPASGTQQSTVQNDQELSYANEYEDIHGDFREDESFTDDYNFPEDEDVPNENPPLVHTSEPESWTSEDEEDEVDEEIASLTEEPQLGPQEDPEPQDVSPQTPEAAPDFETETHEDIGQFDSLSFIPEDEDHLNRQIQDLLNELDSPAFSSDEADNDLDVLSYEDEHLSVHSAPVSVVGGASGQEAGSIHSQGAEDGQEMETAFGTTEGQEATDSSSAWSPEDVDDQDAPAAGHVPISKCGDLDIVLEYKASSQKLTVTVVEAKDIPDKNRSGVDTWQVHVVLFPNKKQRGKTAMQKGSQPAFNEPFTFNKIEPEELAKSAVRFRLYAVQKRIREKMMGEKLYYLKNVKSDREIRKTLVLEPRSNLSSGDSQMSFSAVSPTESASSSQSLSHGGVPELLVGLSYNATTGRLSVQVIKGSHFRNLAINRPPDTYGKLCLLNSLGEELSRCKTSVRRGQPNPVYKETFIFQVALCQLTDATLMIAIYNRRSMKRKEMIGWISLGKNSSGEEEQSHWLEMKDSKGQEVCRWHTLLEA